jgi:hypothetical protein
MDFHSKDTPTGQEILPMLPKPGVLGQEVGAAETDGPRSWTVVTSHMHGMI